MYLPIFENILLLFGMFVFTVFMDLLVRNQISTLNALKDEIRLQWNKINDEHKSISRHFEDIYISLGKRLSSQRRLVRIVDFLVGASLMVIIVNCVPLLVRILNSKGFFL